MWSNSTEAPPCPRGWTPHEDPDGRGQPGSPVPTGMDPYHGSFVCFILRLPRAHGDGPWLEGVLATLIGAPPCPRGWTPPVSTWSACSCGSPVPTGMDHAPLKTIRRGERLPRAHGDGPPRNLAAGTVKGAPPCPRGWTLSYQLAAAQGEGSPVPTGMDPDRPPHDGKTAGLPRAHGDGPGCPTSQDSNAKAPPCPRGWTR